MQPASPLSFASFAPLEAGAAASSPAPARGATAFEALPSRQRDTHYAGDGQGEPYSQGRGEDDGVFRYYARHHVRPAGAAAVAARPGLASEVQPEAGQPRAEALAMSCCRCLGEGCMYRGAPAEQPYCASCNQAAVQPR